MKKTKNISKYNFDWQIVRVLAKTQMSDLNDKLFLVNDFFDNNPTIENQERVINWLEGLSLGYKHNNEDAVYIIGLEIMRYKEMKDLSKENILSKEELLVEVFKTYVKARINLWKDLFKRNEKWLSKGYNQKDLNDFMDFLYLTLEDIDLGRFSYEKLKQLREAALTMKNTHKFLY